MLQNAYLDAKIGVDPAENEPPKECCVVAALRTLKIMIAREEEAARRLLRYRQLELKWHPDKNPDDREGAEKILAGSVTSGARGHDTALFRRLVLGWIEADFRVQIRIF